MPFLSSAISRSAIAWTFCRRPISVRDSGGPLHVSTHTRYCTYMAFTPAHATSHNWIPTRMRRPRSALSDHPQPVNLPAPRVKRRLSYLGPLLLPLHVFPYWAVYSPCRNQSVPNISCCLSICTVLVQSYAVWRHTFYMLWVSVSPFVTCS